jgi:hypothetical protein
VLGTPAATAANNAVLLVYTPGVTPGTGTNAVLLREGDAAPGTAGSIMGERGQQVRSASARIVQQQRQGARLGRAVPRVGDAVVNVNDNMLYLAPASVPWFPHAQGRPAPASAWRADRA